MIVNVSVLAQSSDLIDHRAVTFFAFHAEKDLKLSHKGDNFDDVSLFSKLLLGLIEGL